MKDYSKREKEIAYGLQQNTPLLNDLIEIIVVYVGKVLSFDEFKDYIQSTGYTKHVDYHGNIDYLEGILSFNFEVSIFISWGKPPGWTTATIGVDHKWKFYPNDFLLYFNIPYSDTEELYIRNNKCHKLLFRILDSCPSPHKSD